MWLYLSCGSRRPDLLFLETYRISLTRALGIPRRTFLLPFSISIAWRFNSNHKLTERLSLQSSTLLLPRARPCHRQGSTHHLRHAAWLLTYKRWMFWLGWKKILHPGRFSPDHVLGWTPCPLMNWKIFDFFLFSLCFYMTVSLIRGVLAIISIVMVGISLRKS